MSLINKPVPEFKTQAFHNGKFVEVSNETLKGKWNVLIFMPAAFTFNCPTEIEDAAENYAEFQKMGAEVYIVTTDTHFSHKVWHETSPAVGKAQFPLVGDPTHTLTRGSEVHSNEIARDVSETLRKLKAAQYTAANPGQVCPAKWKEGAATLTPSLDLVGKI
jgi:NADH-dependent peroxiredoxin subunit C